MERVTWKSDNFESDGVLVYPPGFDPARKYPLVLLIHGGSYQRGDRTQLRGYGIALGRAGYTCLACEYRLASESQWPAQIDDVQAVPTLVGHARLIPSTPAHCSLPSVTKCDGPVRNVNSSTYYRARHILPARALTSDH